MGIDGHPEGRVALLIRVTPEMHRRIKLTARARNQSMSELVQRAIRKDLDLKPIGRSIANRIRGTR